MQIKQVKEKSLKLSIAIYFFIFTTIVVISVIAFFSFFILNSFSKNPIIPQKFTNYITNYDHVYITPTDNNPYIDSALNNTKFNQRKNVQYYNTSDNMIKNKIQIVEHANTMFYDSMKSKILYYGATVLLVIIFISILFSILLSRKIIKPLYSYKEIKPLLDDYALSQKNMDKMLQKQQQVNSFGIHEVRNSLAVLQSKLHQGDTEFSIRYMKKVKEAVDSLLTLSVEQISNKQMEEVDLALVAAMTVDEYASRGQLVTFDYDEEKEYIIQSKEAWMYRCFTNLIDNAIKYGEGKEISIRLDRMYDGVIVKVNNKGTQIDEDILDIIWKAYYTSSHFRDGYGLGLSLIKHVVELSGGAVYVESKQEEGTSFYLSFPAYLEEKIPE